MIKYKKMIVLFIVGVLLIGSGAIYTILSDMKTDVQTNTDTSKKDKSTGKKIKQDVSAEQTEEVYTQIENLINGYLNAKLEDNISELNTYVSSPKYIDETKILKQNQYIESYNNIKCTIKKCEKKDTYRVYVYYDIKAFDVEQQLPSLDAYYVVKENDDYKIYFGKIDSSVQKQIDRMDKSAEIAALKNSVDKKMKELISTDEQVSTFLDELKNGD